MRLLPPFKGVAQEASRGDARPWRASIVVEGAWVDLGRFPSEAAAAHAYEAHARVLSQPLNFPSGNFLPFAQHAPMQPADYCQPGGGRRPTTSSWWGASTSAASSRSTRSKNTGSAAMTPNPESRDALRAAGTQAALGLR